LLALQALAIGDLLAVVGDDAFVFGNRLRRVDAPALNFGSAFFDQVDT
jgi:hypothetical protein